MPHILFLTQSSVGDFSFGGGQRTNHLRNALVASGTVDTLIVQGGPHFKADDRWSVARTRQAHLSAYGVSATAFLQRRALKRWIANIIASANYDYIVAQYASLATLVPRNSRRIMIFDPDDYFRSSRPGVPPSAVERSKLRIKNYLARRVANYSMHVWYNNSRPGHVPDNPRRSLLPNVVAIPDPSRPRFPSKRRLLMVGFFDHAPNADGLIWFMENVWSSLSAMFSSLEFHAIGRFNPALAAQLPAVVFRGYVDDLAAEYDQAAVVVAPVRFGGGTQIKVLDALVHERPLVASTFAHAGFSEDFEEGEHLLTADTAADWISACRNLLNQPGDAEAMATRGAKQAAAAFGPHRMVDEVRNTLAKM